VSEPTTLPTIMTLSEGAAFLRVKETTLRDLARRGMVPGRKVGQQWRFSRAQLEAWMLAGEHNE